MAKATTSTYIGGTEMTPHHVSLQQRCDWHHRFEIAVNVEHIEGNKYAMLNKATDYIRTLAEIAIKCEGKTLSFQGIVTSVSNERDHAGNNLIIFEGYSPTYLLEHGIITTSYAEKNLNDIADEIMKVYPDNLVKKKISAQYAEPIPYVVQYKETNYNFLSRMAAIYGEWFYYDGKNIVFGEMPPGDELKLTLGTELTSFNLGIDLRPSNFEYQYYNHEKDDIVKNKTKSFKPEWLDKFGKYALDESTELFPFEPPNPVWYEAQKDAEIKHLSETRKATILSDTTLFKGSSTSAGVAIGNVLNIYSIIQVLGNKVPEFMGSYKVISVTHQFDAYNNYSNRFEAVASKVPTPPVNKNVFKPEAESQIATVEKNYDDKKPGRVCVKFKWQTKKDEMTPWIRVLTTGAYEGRGLYFIPEVGDQVYVDFEQGNPDRPYVTGTLFHGKAKPKSDWIHPENKIKALQTISGHLLKFDDEGGITITDKSNNKIFLDTNGSSISISAPSTITLSATDINLNAGNSVNVNASGSGKNAKGTITMEAKEDVKIGSKTKDVSVQAEAKNVNILSKENVDISSKTKDVKLTASAKNVKIVAASGNVDVSSKETSMKSSSKTRIASGGKAQILGSKVELNKG